MSDVNLNLARRLLLASRVAYRIDAKGGIDPADADLGSLEFISPPATRVSGHDHVDACYIAQTRQEVMLVFRGTLPLNLSKGKRDLAQSLDDWLNDGDALLIPPPDGIHGLVHKGFSDALDVLWPWILRELRSALPEGDPRPLYVAGHSKGGAVAYLAGLRAAKAGLQPAAIYTFAAARCGTSDFVSDCQRSIPSLWRFEFQNDVVPHLAPTFGLLNLVKHFLPDLGSYLATGYESAGTLEFINWDNRVVGDSLTLPFVRLEKLATCFARGDQGITEIIQAHSIDDGSGYASALSLAVAPVGSMDPTSIAAVAPRPQAVPA